MEKRLAGSKCGCVQAAYLTCLIRQLVVLKGHLSGEVTGIIRSGGRLRSRHERIFLLARDYMPVQIGSPHV